MVFKQLSFKICKLQKYILARSSMLREIFDRSLTKFLTEEEMAFYNEFNQGVLW